MKKPKLAVQRYHHHPKYKFVLDLRPFGKGRKFFKPRFEPDAPLAGKGRLRGAHLFVAFRTCLSHFSRLDRLERTRCSSTTAAQTVRRDIVKKTKKGWSVTAAPKQIDTELEDVIVTP